MPRAWPPSGVRSGSSPGRASTRASVAHLVALQALLGLDSVCSSRYVVMLRKVRISLSRMACLETFRGICPPRHPGRLSGPPELPPGALGSCRQRFFPGLHVPAETFLFPYAGVVGLKVCTELPDSFFRMKGYAGAGPGLIQGHRVAVEPLENRWQKPRFWVTFASLNKGLEWLEKASPASFFGPWGGLP